MGKKIIIKGADFSANAVVVCVTTDITSLFTPTWVVKKYIAVADGTEKSTTSTHVFASDYIDISSYDKINITLPELENITAVLGACFYDANHTPIFPTLAGGSSGNVMVPYTFDVPSTAKYIRATNRDDLTGTFKCLGISFS